MKYKEKYVFVLGAGFSQESGAPLVDEFLPKARYLFANRFGSFGTREIENFKKVFDYHEILSGARTKVKIDIDNIEEFFSIIDMNIIHTKEIKKKEELEATREALIYVIIKTLELCIDESRYPVYYNFVKELFDGYIDFSLITFNYDLILERALQNGSCEFNYCTDFAGDKLSNNQTKILKLHGSTNWLVCSKEKCNNLEIFDHKTIYPNFNKKCSKCNGAMVPLLVPPTWNKNFKYEALRSVWSQAFDEISQATYLIFIGYSLPKTDLYFRHFLTLCLKNNKKLGKIILVDRETAGTVNRYNDFFEGNFARRFFSFYPALFRNLRMSDLR
jgi:NAD-dependent SIR2 family protein deacetylase